MSTATLTEFLLARIAEDEAQASIQYVDAMVGHRWKHLPEDAYYELQSRTLTASKRVLAECEAKRRMVDYFADLFENGGAREGAAAEHVLGTLAAVYADHPDYQQEWKP